MTSAFRKFKLMSDEEIDRLKQKQLTEYNPELRTLAHLQTEIEGALERNGADTDEAKYALLQTLQNRFKAVKATAAPTQPVGLSTILPMPAPPVVAAPPAPPVVGAPPIDSAPAQPEETESTQIRLSVLQKAHRKAEQFVKLIGDNPSVVTVDDDNQVVLRGRTLYGSNIIDLINALYTPGMRVILLVFKTLLML